MRCPNRVRVRRRALALLPFCLALAAPASRAQSSRAALLARLDSLAGAPVREGRAVGISVAIVHGKDTLLLRGYGKADIELDVKTPDRAVYEIGSVTKQFTAGLILQLRDEGKLDLDADITKYLPTYPTAGHKLPVRRLLDHTSGIKGLTEIPAFRQMRVRQLPRDSAVALMAAQPFEFPPGEAMIYNNSAYFLLGLIIEKVSGMSYEDYVETRLFAPIGMKDSRYCSNTEVVERRAHGYDYQAGTVRRADYIDHTWPYAAGSLCSTAGDMVAWLTALHGGKVLSERSYREMTTPARLNDGTELRYGMGLSLGTDVRGARLIGHGGAISGFTSDASWYPDAQLAVVVLMNSTGPVSPSALASELAGELITPVRPVARPFTGDAAPLVGRYAGPSRGREMTVEVTQAAQGVAISVNGATARPLAWEDGWKFRSGPAILVFDRPDANGRATVLRYDTGGGHYVLRRERPPGWGERRDPARPEGHRANAVSVSRVETSRLRVTLNHRPGWSSGLSEIEAWGHAPLPLPEPTEPVRNLAFNPGGTGFLRVSASFTSRSDKVTDVNDMRFGFSAYSRNRWTTWGSPNPSDWVEVDFGGPRRIERLDLFLWGDDQGVKAPRRYAVQFWDGQRWAAGRMVRQVPEKPQTFTLNTVWIEPVETNRIRVVLEHDLPATSGITELGVWEPEGSDAAPTRSQATVSRGVFGVLPSRDTVEVYTLRNRGGMEVKAITYGGIITSIRVPDRTGAFDDVVLGHDSLAGYLRDSPYFGAIVGRYGNRIAKGRFTLDGITYRLATNNGSNHLHGGAKGFDKVLWRGSPFEWSGGTGLALSYASPDGEEGYPGTLNVRVTYRLSDANELLVDYEATTDKPTPVNLTQHSYFNLAGDGSGDVLHQLLQIEADSFLPVDSTLIPTGSLAAVAGTPFDFRSPTAIGARIAQDDPQLRNGKGYDHTFVLNARQGQAAAVRVVDPGSGRTLEIVTTEPGVQFYSGNFLDGRITGKAGHVYRRRYGFCLETQHYPDSPNQPRFPSTILRPGEIYRSSTTFRFGITDRR